MPENPPDASGVSNEPFFFMYTYIVGDRTESLNPSTASGVVTFAVVALL